MIEVRKLIATALLAAGLAVVPGAVRADTVIQNQNSSEDAYAESGDAEASNEAEVHAGPQASSGGGSAQASQIGDNDTEVRQESKAKSGDAVAGSQVTGVVGGNGKTTVQNQNNSVGDSAVTGDAFATNFFAGSSGPVADSMFGPSQATQQGSNSVGLDQVTEAFSGDAVSGSQVTGLIS